MADTGKKYAGDKKKAKGNTGVPAEFTWKRFSPILYRVLVWSVLFAILYILKPFFLLIFLTFVFAFIQSSAEHALERFIKSRIIRVLTVGVLILGFLASSLTFLVPRVISQTRVFISQSGTYIERVDRELLDLGGEFPILDEIIPDLKRLRKASDPKAVTHEGARPISPTSALIHYLLQTNGNGGSENDTILDIQRLGTVGFRVAAITTSFLLALLFSFLIILDLPRLSRMVRDLEHTKLGFIYVEVAGTIQEFSLILGKALEAQFFIAIVNSVLTAIGIYILGLGKSIAFLSVIVLFCSFIPVLGVFISSVPICIIALQESGLQGVFFAIALIIVIHQIEAYILNPNIYGTHLRINPVLVLIILTVCGNLFHIWGLILGVPVFTYIFGYAIRYKKSGGLFNSN